MELRPLWQSALLAAATTWLLWDRTLKTALAFQKTANPAILQKLAWVLAVAPALCLSVAAWAALRAIATTPAVRDAAARAFNVEPRDPVTPTRRESIAWFAAGAIFLVACLTWLEVMQPNYFTKDDNYTQFLPNFIFAGRSLLGGVFPTYNPYQYVGEPLMSVGQMLLTYPPLYVAYVIARFVVGNEYHTHDVLCLLHLATSYCVGWLAGRTLGLRPMLATVASLCFVLAGFSLIAGRSWVTVVNATVWLPLMIYCAARLAKGPVDWKWVVGTGLTIGVYFHAGNAQFWLYLVVFFFIAVVALVAGGRVPLERAMLVIPSTLLGVAIAAPLLMPQLDMATRVHRRWTGIGGGVDKGFWSLLLPFPWATSHHPNNWENTAKEVFGQFYYSGTLFFVATAVAILLLAVYRTRARLIADNVWLLCALLAFWLGLGNGWGLWSLQSKLPFLKSFKGPYKLLHFVNLFCVFGGGLFVERLLRGPTRRVRTEVLLASVMGAVLLYHVSICRSGWGYVDERPYPQPPERVMELLRAEGQPKNRVLVVQAGKWPASAVGLGEVYATVHEVPAFWGYSADDYETTVYEMKELADRMNHDPIAAARAYGVRWLIAYKLNQAPKLGEYIFWPRGPDGPPRFSQAFQALSANAHELYNQDGLWMLELNHWDPMVFWQGNPEKPLPVHLRGDGIETTLDDPKGGKIVFNALWRREILVQADGKVVTTRPDEWNRIVADVPAGARRIRVHFAFPRGTTLATLTAFLLFAATLLTMRKQLGKS